jgi:hypothetical protein
MTRLSRSVDRVTALLADTDLAADATVRELLAVIKDKLNGKAGDVYLKVGRKLARITTAR